jgi:hypothetical protein
MKLKIFSVKPRQFGKPKFESLEASVNEWLADHPNIVIENTNGLTQPNLTWSHLAVAVWYTDE